MKLLHSSDWHVGKVSKGVSRLDEQKAVLAGIVELTRREAVDIVLVAGDLYESAVPPAEAQRLVWSTLLALRDTGAHVVVIAGNHDNVAHLEALRPLALAAGITVVAEVRRPDDGGVVELAGRGGERAKIAAFPFLSQRSVVKAAQLMSDDSAQHAGTYADRCRRVIGALCDGFGADTVNVVVAHGMVRGGQAGGGEREAQTVFEDYWIDATAFPATAQYVALGHLHRSQELAGATRIWYSGSPIQIDFGEGGHDKFAMLVDVSPGLPAQVTQVQLPGVRRLRTVEGTLNSLRTLAVETADDLLRVIVQEPARAGLADAVRAALPNAIDIRIAAGPTLDEAAPSRAGLTHRELFRAFLDHKEVSDESVEQLFARLLDESTGGAA